MIILDTHIWIWWVHGSGELPPNVAADIDRRTDEGIGVSAISCWEVAKLVERRRLSLPHSLPEWFEKALAYPGVQLIPLTPEMAVQSTQLPGDFHRDPADQIIVAAARLLKAPLVTLDEKIRRYAHVTLLI